MQLPDGIIMTQAGVFVLEKDSHLSRWVEEHRRLDVAEKQIEFYSDKIKPGMVVLDAGACIGDHTETYRKLVGLSGTVWALEPNPLTYEALRLNFMACDNVMTRNVALSDYEGRTKMHQEVNVGASFLTPYGQISVDVTTIDALKFDRLDFIHLDCEGCEPKVLMGGLHTIQRFKPVIVLEIAHRELARYGCNEKALLALIDSLGYSWRELEKHHGSHLPNRDIICLPK
jgi:FkbM family methyltransferase